MEFRKSVPRYSKAHYFIIINTMRTSILILTTIMFFNVRANTPSEIACQAWTFKNFTFEETLVKLESLGIKSIEMYSGQKLFNEEALTSNFTMSVSTRQRVLHMLKAHKIKLVSYGVITPKTKEEWVQLFTFAKSMGIKTIVSEPEQKDLAYIDGLCAQYKIKLAIHNHPDPTRYWNPDITLEALTARSAYMGVCADIGHWTRSGLDAVACLKKLEGRLIEIHYKDVNTTDKTGYCVVWGTGKIDMAAIKKELDRQKFKGNIVIEYEYNWDNSVPDIQKSIEAYLAVSKN